MHKRLLLISSATFALVAPALACAQAAPPPADAPKDGIEEIVVTARRVAERLQDVPVAVTAVNAQAIQEQHMTQLQDVRYVSPSLNISPSPQGPTIPGITLRGQRASRTVVGQDTTIGVYMNEFVQTRPAGLNSTLYDIESVQVLNGPQGTLFGRNTTGGAIIITPKKPNSDQSAQLSLEGGNFGHYAVTSVVNAPITDKLMFRFAGNVGHRDGYMYNQYNGQRSYDLNDRSYRGSILWRPTDKIESLTIFDGYNSNTHGFLVHISYITPGTAVGNSPQALQSLARVQAAGSLWVSEGDSPTFEKTRSFGASNVTSVDINPNLTFKNVIGYRTVRAVVGTDNDGTAAPLISAVQTNRADWWSEEAQLVGRSKVLDWIGGVYYYLEDGTDLSFGRNNSPNYNNTGGSGRNYSYAAFGQGTIKLDSVLDGLSIVAGGRYTHDLRQITAKGTSLNPATNVTTCLVRDPNNNALPIGSCQRVARVSYNQPTYNFGLNWKASPRTLLYVATRRGYRAGGVNVRAVNVPDFIPFRPEVVRDVEGGIKTDFNLGSVPMRTNFAVYHQWFNDVQRNQNVLATGVNGQILSSTTVFNAAKAQLSGFEAQVTAKLSRAFEITGTYSFIDAKYDRYINPANGADLSNNKFADTPRNQGAITGRYQFEPWAGKGRISASATFFAQSGIELIDVNLDPYTQTSGYHVVNAQLQWQQFLGTKLDVTVYGTNLTNEQYVQSGLSTISSSGYTVQIPGPPRMYGIRADYQF